MNTDVLRTRITDTFFHILMVFDSRINQAVEQVRQEIDEKDKSRKDDDHRLKGDVIPVLHGENHHLPETGPAIDDFREHGSSHQDAPVESDHRYGGNQSIPQGMFIDDHPSL